MKAVCRIREAPHYRRDAFQTGLRITGFKLVPDLPAPQPGDLLVIWNRYGYEEQLALTFEGAGATVIVAENGYLGHHEDAYAKPYTSAGDQLYALALGHHNGAGQWWIGAPGRWREQGIEVQPWRCAGEHVLVLPQRGIGPEGIGMPSAWIDKTCQRLRKVTERSIRVRSHPGNLPATKPLLDDLRDAWAVVTWGSGAAIKALVAGVPAFADFKRWIGRPGARFDLEQIEMPLRHDGARELMLDRLAWAQWTVSEIATGAPFRKLLNA
jgi:hypothetical protein